MNKENFINNTWEKERYSIFLNYDKRFHLKLLDQKNLNDELTLTLRYYSNIMLCQLYWESRFQYLDLVNELIGKKIDSLDFFQTFDEIRDRIYTINDFLRSNKLLLCPHKNCLEFADLIREITEYTQAYDDEPEPFRTKSSINEIEFISLMEEMYLKLNEVIEK